MTERNRTDDLEISGDSTEFRRREEYSDGLDRGLEPLVPLDIRETAGFSDLLERMKATAFGGRQLGEAADVLVEMVEDEDCFVVGTFTGAMTVAKQGLLLCEMIDNGMLQAVVSTGALMAHGLVESAGMTHFKAPTDLDDRAMYYKGYDRVYDTLELEKNLDDVEAIFHRVLDSWPGDETAASHTLNREIGRWLEDNTEGRGVLKSALRADVPVYVPAFTDSEIGLDFAIYNTYRQRDGKPRIAFDPFLDLDDYTRRMLDAKHLGIFTIGGGVPRNWAQQIGPYLEALAHRTGNHRADYKRFRYGVRICPEPVHWGGLSGCTYSEGISWGKFLPPNEGGRYAEVPADATLVWPLLIAGALERLER